jgi:hypothetical protein
MSSLHRFPWSRRLAQAGLGGLFSLAAGPLAALASPGIIYDYIPGTRAQLPGAQSPGAQLPGARMPGAYGGSGPQALPTPSIDPAQLQALQADRCNIGRLVGGLVGGGLGYATSRQDGRSWAVPLGALLGQQMGCSIGAGRGPRPW